MYATASYLSFNIAVADAAQSLYERERRELEDAAAASAAAPGNIKLWKGMRVLTVGPYNVPPGPLRQSWIKAYEKSKLTGDELPVLVYHYNQKSNMDSCFSLVQKPTELQDLLDAQRKIPKKIISELAKSQQQRLDVLPRFREVFESSCLAIGQRLSVYWPKDEAYFSGVVEQIDGGFCYVLYDDGDEEWIRVADRKLIIHSDKNCSDGNNNSINSINNSNNNSNSISHSNSRHKRQAPPNLISSQSCNSVIAEPSSQGRKECVRDEVTGVWVVSSSYGVKRKADAVMMSRGPTHDLIGAKDTNDEAPRWKKSKSNATSKTALSKHSVVRTSTPAEKLTRPPRTLTMEPALSDPVVPQKMVLSQTKKASMIALSDTSDSRVAIDERKATMPAPSAGLMAQTSASNVLANDVPATNDDHDNESGSLMHVIFRTWASTRGLFRRSVHEQEIGQKSR